MKYSVYYEERAAKELARIDHLYQLLIKKKIDQLTSNYESMTRSLKPLKGKYDYYRLRVGPYRVIFHKDENRVIIIIVRIGHRQSIYKEFES